MPVAEVKRSSARGRPARADGPTTHLSIRLSPAEQQCIRAAAMVERKSLADYARDVLLSESADLLEEPAGQLRTP